MATGWRPQEAEADFSWRDRARCKGMDPDIFHPERDEQEGKNKDIAAPAKAVCAECPVRKECLEYAIANGIRVGIWGGMNYISRCAYNRTRAITVKEWDEMDSAKLVTGMYPRWEEAS